MRNGYIGLAILGAIAIGGSGAALAQTCPPGQILQNGICLSAATPGAAAAAPSARAPATTTTTTTAVRAPTTTTTTATAAPSAARPATPAPAAPPAAMSGSSMPPAEKAEACPTGFSLYNHGCYPTQDAAHAMMR